MTRGLLVLVGLVAVAAIVILLFLVVFPWVDRRFLTDPTMGLVPSAVNSGAGG